MRWRAGILLVAMMLPRASGVQAQDTPSESGLREAVEGVAGCMLDRRLVLGEKHGTREIPLLVGDLAERLSRTGPLLLALEIHAANTRSCPPTWTAMVAWACGRACAGGRTGRCPRHATTDGAARTCST